MMGVNLRAFALLTALMACTAHADVEQRDAILAVIEKAFAAISSGNADDAQ
ncbi:MAG: hypothetical protein O2907_09915 [Proteobacteria bacterium]|nr:hypothetical protein [Pseudomonadota bacterium]MDA1064621.1 hypothetical protein [Pseudomonadota bacterium]